MQNRHSSRKRKAPDDAAQHILSLSDRRLNELIELARQFQARGLSREAAATAAYHAMLKAERRAS